MAREKRTKPCSNCKKSKVKCVYQTSLPCERCLKSGQAVSCQFVPKLPSLKLPQIPPSNSGAIEKKHHGWKKPGSAGEKSEMSLPPLNPISKMNQITPSRMSPAYIGYQTNGANGTGSVQKLGAVSAGLKDGETKWKGQIESSISMLDSKLSELANILKATHRNSPERFHEHYTESNYISQAQSLNQSRSSSSSSNEQDDSFPPSRSYTPSNAVPEDTSESFQSIKENHYKRTLNTAEEYSSGQYKKIRQDGIDGEFSEFADDFRGNVLSLYEARELFKYFVTNISPQLFGFEISKFNIDYIWKSSPILICAICTIASKHHPDSILKHKLNTLQKHLHRLCAELLYQGTPCTEVEGFNSIVALVLCSFWLSDSQMFTGLAFQLAKEIGLNRPRSKHEGVSDGLSEKDRLKLWYLLYVLDGQQSLTFNRQPMIDSQEYTLKYSKKMLMQERETIEPNHDNNQSQAVTETGLAKQIDEERTSKRNYEEGLKRNRFNDMCLVSQVEYNQALDEAFKGNAWDLLAPLSFGIPSKSNLELDKWMVSWTVLLSPTHNGAVWSSKSTLIYYNFAKMHINSSAVRQLKMDSGARKLMFPKWKQVTVAPEESKMKATKIPQDHDFESDSDEEEFVSNKDRISEDETSVSANIAVNAAQTVLNLVLSDSDILENLKYVPVHIHIMLYYAALLIINPPSESCDKNFNFNAEKHFSKIITSLKLVKNLQRNIYVNLPTDEKFGNRLIDTLGEVLDEKLNNTKRDLNESPEIGDDAKSQLVQELQVLINSKSSDNIVEVTNDKNFSTSNRSSSPGPEKIVAWPGTNHGHP